MNLTANSATPLGQRLERLMETKLAAKRIPQNPAMADAAQQAYRAGWRAAVQVAGNRPDIHPADRHMAISHQRLTKLLAQLPQTGLGWLSGREYDLQTTCRKYARMGYGDSVEYAARIGWHDFLATSPSQTTSEMLAKRQKALDDIHLFGCTDQFTAKGLTYLPKTENGALWMLSQLRYGPDRI